jgi:hypothetical protein
MEATLGGKITAAAILDKDFRSEEECTQISKKCLEFCDFVRIHKRKEIENFLIVPTAIDRAISHRLNEQSRRLGISTDLVPSVAGALSEYCDQKKSYVAGQSLESKRRFERQNGSSQHESKITELAFEEFEKSWNDAEIRLNLIPGKEAISAVNKFAQDSYDVSITPIAIVDAMTAAEIPMEMLELVELLKEFSKAT